LSALSGSSKLVLSVKKEKKEDSSMSINMRLAIYGVAVLGICFASGAIHAEATGPLVAPTNPDSPACVTNDQAGTKCPNWNAIPEKFEPDACISDARQAGKGKCARWYSYGAPKSVVIRTNLIHFEFDKSRILSSSYPVLNQIVATIQGTNVRHVTIEGHTDSKGSDAYNLALSGRRAASVREYLSNHGIESGEMSSVGKGESQPVASNEINGRDNPGGRDLNRRVEFHLQLASGSKAKVMKGDSGPTFPDSTRQARSGTVSSR
jgi:outer membrane protein OmpA-like peptidoglycan-associated protein